MSVRYLYVMRTLVRVLVYISAKGLTDIVTGTRLHLASLEKMLTVSRNSTCRTQDSFIIHTASILSYQAFQHPLRWKPRLVLIQGCVCNGLVCDGLVCDGFQYSHSVTGSV